MPRIALFSFLTLFWLITAIVSPAQQFTNLFQFDGTNGRAPVGPLIQGFDGNLYGVTTYGGTYNEGTVFKITRKGVLTTLYNFCPAAISPYGCQPFAGLALGRDGNFYGTTSTGGKNNGSAGVVFKITSQGTLTLLHSFCALANCMDGEAPWTGLIQASNGNFYGSTIRGGANGDGVIFKITPAGSLSTLHSFCSKVNCADGESPLATLIQATGGGNLYGATAGGGANSEGTVFKITLSGSLTTIHNFCPQPSCADGRGPNGALVQASDGNYYGTTVAPGTVFKITPQGVLMTIYTFCSQSFCIDGESPTAGLVQATDGNFYGTTDEGGTYGRGTVFKITSTGTLTTLHSFPSVGSVGGLMQATDGALYGTKFGGGTGSIFKINLGLGPFVKTLPTAGKAGTRVIILGTNLTGASAVSFHGMTSAFTLVSSTENSTTVPTGATTGKVTVKTAGGTLSSNTTFVIQ